MDQEPRLNTWKEIAEYLGVSLRTAENYEQQKGLPVHRMGSDRSRVWAYRAELDAWKSQKAGQAAAPAAGSAASEKASEELIPQTAAPPSRPARNLRPMWLIAA